MSFFQYEEERQFQEDLKNLFEGKVKLSKSEIFDFLKKEEPEIEKTHTPVEETEEELNFKEIIEDETVEEENVEKVEEKQVIQPIYDRLLDEYEDQGKPTLTEHKGNVYLGGGGIGRFECDDAIQTQAQDALFTPAYNYSATTIKDALYQVDNRLTTLALSAGAVTSVFGRASDVVAQSGDYNAAQISYENTNVSAALVSASNYDSFLYSTINALSIIMTNYDNALSADIVSLSADIDNNYYTKTETNNLVSSVSSTLNNELNNFTLNELSDVDAVSAQNYSMLTYVSSSNSWDASTVQWDDLLVPATQLRLGATLKPDFDFTNLGLLFPQNDATEQAYLSVQFSHKRKNGSDIVPHIHIIQTTSALPVFVLQYRWYMNGSIVPNYTTVSATSGVFPYTSGSMMQIMPFPKINGTSISAVSSQFDGIIWRNDNIVVGDVLFKQFDIHYQSDSFGGSRNEYSK